MKVNKPKFWDKNYPTIFSILLLPISYIYQIMFKIKKLFTSERKFSIPIICVGNIYLGGTGKTPLCMKIFELLKDIKKPIVIKKDYKNQNDEIELLRKYSKVITCDNRNEGIEKAINKNFDLVILDDGFQDFTIRKNLNIICFNDNQKVGNGLNIPAGPLRENLSALKRCNIVFINGKKNLEFEEKLKKNNRNLSFYYFNYYSKNSEEFKNKKLIAFAGIGNASNFFRLLKSERLNVVKEIEFPDHYNYSEKNLDDLIEMEKKYKAKLITTEKDYLRISTFKRRRFSYLPIKVSIEQESDFLELLKKIKNENI
tara:strand:+ start:7343 stop:8281 length:939 start_codon:yes stop_codon:yes gene_type:complete